MTEEQNVTFQNKRAACWLTTLCYTFCLGFLVAIFSFCSKLIFFTHEYMCAQLLSRVRLLPLHRLQPARLLCPWNLPGKNTGVGCHFLLQHIFDFQMSRPSSNNTREDSTHGHQQIVNAKIRLIIFFAAKDGEDLYSQQKQDQELIVIRS